MGTAVVWEGDTAAPTVLVLDPARDEMHRELPPDWRQLTGERQIVWCQLPAAAALPEARRLLAEPDALGRPIDVVTCGGVPDEVRRLVADHPGPLRSLLLVDPDEDEQQQPIDGVTVRTVGSPGRSRPLGRADVREEVEAAIAALDATLSERSDE
ncbi:hypothetical protein [Prauserella muralis]|uniref:Uncharacterized protein n=1 Tax=Prauserella muralis TaxID=588067 RepID=A0A2V4AGJ5_9PSEU|nr:hypothetical protein [Prauserella muralis]PXY19044.1 hypothetical protein BAY60_29970 [Prauserella muralis]TWE28940.1 hypothetical protein FHX69_1609 [Prauserella muralis]